jgi:hypothetical protein
MLLMPGVRSKRCRQARPLTGWVDSKRESTGKGGTLVNAEPRCFRREEQTYPVKGGIARTPGSLKCGIQNIDFTSFDFLSNKSND